MYETRQHCRGQSMITLRQSCSTLVLARNFMAQSNRYAIRLQATLL